MSNFARDIRHALRTLTKDLSFTVIAVSVLALGIGANTAIFSLINATLLQPLPYGEPDDLVLLWEQVPSFQLDLLPVSEANYLQWRERNSVFSDVTAFRVQDRAISDDVAPETVTTISADADLFATLRVSMRLGRGFAQGDDRPGADPVAVISHELWQGRFGGDPGIVGRPIRLDGVLTSVVGVLGENFRFPPPMFLLGGMYELNASLLVPVHFTPTGSPERNVVVIGRLRPNLSLVQAQKDLEPVADQIVEALRQGSQLSVVLVPLHGQAVQRAGRGLLILLGAVTLVLLIACVNVSNLLLARAPSRSREIAVRLALGAGRSRVIRQLLLESLVLALLSGLLGLLLSSWSLALVLEVSSGHVPRMGDVTIDSTVLAFALLTTALTGLLFGLVPALQTTRPDLNRTLKEDGRGTVPGGRGHTRSVLVVAEVALAVMLLVGAGLLLKSLRQIHRVDPGFVSGQVQTLRIQLPEGRYPEDAQVQAFYRRLLEEFEAIPQMEGVGAVSGLPLSGDRYGSLLEIEGMPTATLDERMTRLTALRITTPGYFQAMGIPLVQGRTFQDSDRSDSEPVAVVDRALAERFWPDGDAIGSRATFDEDDDPEAVWRRIVGIVEDVRQESLDRPSQMEGTIYYALDQFPFREMSVVLRTASVPGVAASAIRERLQRLDPQLPLRSDSLESLLRSARSEQRSPAILLGAFAGLAVLLSVVGLYGVISFLVEQRTREIGIRMAIGAAGRDILGMVTRETTPLILLGIVLGTGGALALSKALASQLYEVSPTDPVTYGSVALLFALVAGASSYIPARRASKLDPVVALRQP